MKNRALIAALVAAVLASAFPAAAQQRRRPASPARAAQAKEEAAPAAEAPVVAPAKRAVTVTLKDGTAVAGDYAGADLPEAAVLRRWGGQAVVLPYLDGHSTTALVERSRVW